LHALEKLVRAFVTDFDHLFHGILIEITISELEGRFEGMCDREEISSRGLLFRHGPENETMALPNESNHNEIHHFTWQ
jgi:hypothetical protein